MKFLLAILALAPFSSAFAAPQPAALLAKICAPGDIKGSECAKPKNYPTEDASQSCPITITKVIEAHLLSASSTLVVADYENPCEPHVNNWGGAAYFKKQGKDYTFAGYQQGARYADCAVVTVTGGKDRMACQTSYLGQGYLESSISEVTFAQNHSGNVSAQYDVLVSATSNEGAVGAESIACPTTEFPYLIGLTLPAQNTSGTTVKVEAEYADAALAKTACLKPYSAKAIAEGTGRANMAPLPSVHKGLFTLNLNTRKFVPTTK